MGWNNQAIYPGSTCAHKGLAPLNSPLLQVFNALTYPHLHNNALLVYGLNGYFISSYLTILAIQQFNRFKIYIYLSHQTRVSKLLGPCLLTASLTFA